MTTESAWHAEGLRWIAGILQDAAAFLEREPAEELPPEEPQHCVAQTRLRVHLRGF